MHYCDLATLTHQRTNRGRGAMARVFQCLQGVFTKPGQLHKHRAANASHCIGHQHFPPQKTHDMTADELRLVYHAKYVDCDHNVWSCPVLSARDRDDAMDRDQERKRHHDYHAEVRCQELRERNLQTNRPPGEGQTHRNADTEAEHAQTRDTELPEPRQSHPDDGLWCNPPSPGHYSDTDEIVHEREYDLEELIQEQGTCRTNTDLHRGHRPEWERSRSKNRSRSRSRTRSRSRSRSRHKTRCRNQSRGSNRGHARKRNRSRSASRRRSQCRHTSIFIVDARSSQSAVKRHNERTAAGTRHDRDRRSGGKTEQRDYRGNVTDKRSIHRGTPGDSRSRGGDQDSRGRSNRGKPRVRGRARERQRDQVREQDRKRKRERE